MGWKSTDTISRQKAIELILKRIDEIEEFSNDELSDALIGLGYGDNPKLSHFGYNFSIESEKPNENNG